jgi:fibronectin type 3 domain-containing protein
MPDNRTTLSSAPFFFGEPDDRRKMGRARKRAASVAITVTLLSSVTAGVLAASTAGAAETLMFGPAADTYVGADRPTRNNGSAASLQVDNSPVRHILMRFSVSGVGTRSVVGAKLRLYNVDSSSAGGTFFRVSDNSWGETTVTWNTAPAAASTPLASLGAVAANTWYEVNLASLITGDGTYSLKITSGSTNGADYTSREGAVGFRPQLVVTAESAADITSPTVSITAPAAGATVSGLVTVQATASDNVGVSKVDLRVDGAVHGTDTASPYAFVWDSAATSNGSHTLVAVASDAAGNTALSPELTVNVSNATPDITPPSPPTGLVANAPSPNRIDLSWNSSTDDVGVVHYAISRDGFQIGTTISTTYSDTTVSAGATYGYSITAHDAAGNPSPPSATVSVTTPPAPPATSFVFGAGGDHGANSKTSATLRALDASGASFYLALGDLDYDETPTDEAWCDFVKANLPTLGPTFPFELVAGNHEEQAGVDGYILNHAACLPDRLGSTIGPGSVYGGEYYFDYPAGAPLMRVVMISPHLTVENVRYDYDAGTPHHQWLVSAIDGARASGIPWVAVGMHHPCISAGEKLCGMADLMNLLIEKKVDLVLQAHDHNYQRSKQLEQNTSTCPIVPINAYDPDCVVDDGADGIYPKGAGTVMVVNGAFGRNLYAINPADPEAPYFARLDSTSNGFSRYTVTAGRIDGTFVNSNGSFTDSFSIVAGQAPNADITPPSEPTGLTATPRGGTTMDLSWRASTDNVAVDRYLVFRDDVPIASTTTTSYSDPAVVPGTVYTYSVRAFDTSGNPSPLSARVTVTAPQDATTLYFVPTADTYVRSDVPTRNYGSATALGVDNSPMKHILLKFNVSGIGARTVLSAKLRLANVDDSSMGGVFYRVPDTSWGETTVNWDTAPAADGTPVASLGAVTPGNTYEVDLSSLVRTDGLISIKAVSTSSNGADYVSREGTPGLGPLLVVTLQS